MPSIRRKKSKSSDDDSVASESSSTSSMSRSKKFKKSIKGIIKRKSKKKKSAVGLSVESVPEGRSLEFNDKENKEPPTGADDATEYGVELDKSERTTDPAIKDFVGSVPPLTSAEALRLVLLLLDPYSRRFELLQLEFDAKRAHVSDVLDQIPLTATEGELRDKDYTGLCNRNGTEMKKGLLSECEYDDGVLVAIPNGLTSKQCAQLAKPILFDPKVLATFKPNPAPSQEQAALPRVAETEETTEPEATKPKDTDALEPPKPKERSVTIAEPVKEKSGSSFLSRFILLGFLIAALSPVFVLLQEKHTAPMSPGDVLSPGDWKSTCGLLSFLPTSLSECNQGVLEMGQDGVLAYSEGSEVVWSLTGGVCEAGDEGCSLGAVVTETGSVIIGGVDVSDDVPDTWPFKKVAEVPVSE